MSDVNGLELKTCTKCGVPQLLDCFRVRPKYRNRNSHCKMCESKEQKRCRERNPAPYLAHKTAYTAANKEKIREKDRRCKRGYDRRREKTDPVFKMKRRISSLIRKAMKGTKNGSSLWKYVPYTQDELKNHLEKQFEPWMSWNNWGAYRATAWKDDDASTWTWQIDHIKPSSTFTYTSMNDDRFRQCWALDNLRPLSAKQNVIEGNRRLGEHTR